MRKIKYVCDNCKKEMNKDDSNNLDIVFNFTKGDVGFAMHENFAQRDTEDIHVCKYCMIDKIVKEYDDRVRQD